MPLKKECFLIQYPNFRPNCYSTKRKKKTMAWISPWISSVKVKIVSSFSYATVVQKIDSSDLSPQEFEDAISKIQNYDPLSISSQTPEENRKIAIFGLPRTI